MDRHLIKTLIDALAASDLSELEYTSGGETLRLVRSGAGHPETAAAVAAPVRPVTGTVPPSPVSEPPASASQADIVTAPLYGIVHLHRSPGAPMLAPAGQAVAAGDVLCLIEAMKVFTELRAERDGTVAAVLVETGQEVDAGQPLFRLG